MSTFPNKGAVYISSNKERETALLIISYNNPKVSMILDDPYLKSITKDTFIYWRIDECISISGIQLPKEKYIQYGYTVLTFEELMKY